MATLLLNHWSRSAYPHQCNAEHLFYYIQTLKTTPLYYKPNISNPITSQKPSSRPANKENHVYASDICHTFPKASSVCSACSYPDSKYLQPPWCCVQPPQKSLVPLPREFACKIPLKMPVESACAFLLCNMLRLCSLNTFFQRWKRARKLLWMLQMLIPASMPSS